MPRHSTVRRFASIGMSAISVVASAVLISFFGFSDDVALSNESLVFIATAIVVSIFAVSSLVASRKQMFRHWRVATVSFLGMTTLVVLSFMLWLQLGADEALARLTAIGLPGIVAVVIARRLAQEKAAASAPCPECGMQTPVHEEHCTNCGTILGGSEETLTEPVQIYAPEQERTRDAGSRILAGMLDFLLLLIVVEIAFRIALYGGLGYYSLLNLQDLVLFLLAFSLVYNPLLVGIFATTPGKRALKLRVIMSDGSRVGFRRALLRELAKFGPMLLVNAVVMASRADRRGLHDLLADTVVVRREGS